MSSEIKLSKGESEANELFESMKGFRVKHSHSRKCARIAQERVVRILKENGINSELQNNVLMNLKSKK